MDGNPGWWLLGLKPEASFFLGQEVLPSSTGWRSFLKDPSVLQNQPIYWKTNEANVFRLGPSSNALRTHVMSHRNGAFPSWASRSVGSSAGRKGLSERRKRWSRSTRRHLSTSVGLMLPSTQEWGGWGGGWGVYGVAALNSCSRFCRNPLNFSQTSRERA